MPKPMSEREYVRRSVLSTGTVAAGAANVGALALCACPVAELLSRYQAGLPFTVGWLVVDLLMFVAGMALMAAGYWTLLRYNMRMRHEYMEGRE